MSMRAGAGVRRGWSLAIVLVVCAVFSSGCLRSVDPAELPGVYRNQKVGGEIVLRPDGTFSATGVSTGYTSSAADFGGRWEFVKGEWADDFVYLLVDGDGLGLIGGVQLYAEGGGEVYFRADPDGPPNLVLKKVAAP
ncbi:hypothetical protein ACGFXC_05210 [Streptomyces sp. NPDC048507]|uniref:hypothetical protein n=1 Tax=Streptomyces sp. NPDC048507 TaxID=3365560 RepID=UPI003718EF81